jgi:signal transduction histidine kinase
MTSDLNGRAAERSCSTEIGQRFSIKDHLDPLTKVKDFHHYRASPPDEKEFTWPPLDSLKRRSDLDEKMRHQSKLEAIGQVTVGIAHDFNNLLTAIIGNLTLLIDRLEDEQSRRLARRSLSAAELAATVTKRVLAFGRDEHLMLRRVNLNRFVGTVVPRLRELAGGGIPLEIVASPNNGSVRMDPIHLELALINLVTNARDAMPGGGRIVIETSWLGPFDKCHDVSPGEWGVICVRDSGCGIPSEVIDRVFDPFFTTKKMDAGTGLGLSMVRDVVKGLGGEVVIRSRLGVGTTVQIYLPRSAVAASRGRERRRL